MTFAELKKICSPATLVSVSTEFYDKEEKVYRHGMTIGYNVSIGDKRSFPDGAWFDNYKVIWIAVCESNLLMVVLLESEKKEIE